MADAVDLVAEVFEPEAAAGLDLAQAGEVLRLVEGPPRLRQHFGRRPLDHPARDLRGWGWPALSRQSVKGDISLPGARQRQQDQKTTGLFVLRPFEEPSLSLQPGVEQGLRRPRRVDDVDGNLAVVDLAGCAAVLAGHANALSITLGEVALIDDKDAVRVTEFGGNPVGQFGAERGVGPEGIGENDLSHAHLGGIAVDFQRDGFGGLVVVVVQEKSAEVGVGAGRSAVITEVGDEASDEVVEERNGLEFVSL